MQFGLWNNELETFEEDKNIAWKFRLQKDHNITVKLKIT
jgi:hypothetical protein